MAQKSITSAEQLRGKTLGISAQGSLTDILMREGLRLNGIGEKDVTIIPVGDEGGRLSSLQTGRVHEKIAFDLLFALGNTARSQPIGNV